ncbi:MAG: hypothetical protein E7604_04295 [Ruminococcaceae bacterium]|nr:hypothetical protein [Oscillospiraceae bacterium]
MKKNNLHDGHRDRLRERFLMADETHTVDSQFREHELLELMLFFSQPRVNTNETAHRLLNRFGSIRGVFEAPYAALLQVKGVGPRTAQLIRLICALMRIFVSPQAPALSDVRLTSLSALLPVIRRMYFAESAVEHVFLMLFGADGSHRKTIRISDGTQTGVTLDIPRCVQMAVMYDAAAAILVHNHPSAAEPSEEDRVMTNRLKDAFDSVRIELREHLVLTDDTCFGILGGAVIEEDR